MVIAMQTKNLHTWYILVPGLKQLNTVDQALFFNSAICKSMQQQVSILTQNFLPSNPVKLFWQALQYGWLLLRNTQPLAQEQMTVEDTIVALQTIIFDHPTFYAIKIKLIYNLLLNFHNELSLFSEQDFNMLCNNLPLTQFYPELSQLTQAQYSLRLALTDPTIFLLKKNQLHTQLDTINLKIHAIQQSWYTYYNYTLTNNILLNQGRLSALSLRSYWQTKLLPSIFEIGEIYPFLYHPIRSGQKKIINKLNYLIKQLHQPIPEHINTFLLEILPDYLNQLFTAQWIPAFQYKKFNQIIAQTLSFLPNKNNDLLPSWQPIETVLTHYEQQLLLHIQQLFTFNNQNHIFSLEIIAGSMSSLLRHNRLLNKAQTFIKQIALAHRFIQAIDVGAQSDHPLFSMLTAYNYYQIAPHISRALKVLQLLTKPIQQEYEVIIQSPQSSIMKLFYGSLPILLFTAIAVALLTVLSIIGLPEIALLIALVPVLALSCAFTSVALYLKNQCMHRLRAWFYGGYYATPEFQVNTRIQSLLPSEPLANMVRTLYIDAMELCKQQERIFMAKETQGVLLNLDLINRETNNKQHYLLCAEWYEMNSNNSLPLEKARMIVLSRCQETLHNYYTHYNTIKAEQFSVLNTSMHESIQALIQALSTAKIPYKLPLSTNNTALSWQNSHLRLFKSDILLAQQNKLATVQNTINYLYISNSSH